MEAPLVINALAEPRRQQILRLVRDQPMSIHDLRVALEITQQAVSQHLQVLSEAGLVKADREGRGRLYSLAPDGLNVLDSFLSELWSGGLQKLKSAVEARRDS
jgi:DNA-binding transcriptional ArsR family regulator